MHGNSRARVGLRSRQSSRRCVLLYYSSGTHKVKESRRFPLIFSWRGGAPNRSSCGPASFSLGLPFAYTSDDSLQMGIIRVCLQGGNAVGFPLAVPCNRFPRDIFCADSFEEIDPNTRTHRLHRAPQRRSAHVASGVVGSVLGQLPYGISPVPVEGNAIAVRYRIQPG